MSSTSPSPNPSPPVDLSPSTNSPPSNSSAPPPTRDSPPPLPNTNPSASTPPPTNSSTPPPTNSTTPPPNSPTPSPPPPSDSPPPSAGVTPPPSNSEPPQSPPGNGTSPPSPSPPSPPPPSSRPPVAPPTPIAPPPRNNTPPAPPPNNPPLRPSPSPPSGPGAPPRSPPPVIPPRPSPPAPPGQSPPAPPTLQPPPADLPAPQPSVPGSPLPPQSNTTVPGSSTPPSAPTTPTENPPADFTPSSTGNATGSLPVGGVIAIVLVGLLALSLVVFAAWFIHRRKKRRSGAGSSHGNTPSPFVPSQNTDSISRRAQNAAISSDTQSPYHSAHPNGSSAKTNPASTGEPGGIGNSKPLFRYQELVWATNGFSEANLLGEGGFGCVYKGTLADGREVAVKQLKIGGGQGEREFQAEVEIISRIHHRHLVSIVGYCISDFQRLLVYDYVPNNTLYYHLHGNVSAMTWPTRFKVAAGAARGIAYLHEDCSPRIIHRDIKSSNILLDNNFEAKVADFGLAKLALELEVDTHISTRVMGTFGYMAPEYATTGKLTEKSDVFSFGVVLLELITGRKPVDSSQQLGDESLVEWARPLLTQALETESFENLVDPRLKNEYVHIEMFRIAEAAAACVRHSALKRPKMSQVVRAIDSISEVQDLTNGMKPGDSQIVDSREQSAQIRLFQRMAFGSHEYTTDDFSSSQSSKSGL